MSTESNRDPRQPIIEGDYRLTPSENGIKIEVLDYHPDPLELTDELLRKLGITIAREPRDH